jgi:hypothetical protein
VNLLEPQPIDSAFCSCPACGSLGHHIITVTTYESFCRTYPDGTLTDPANPRAGSPLRIDRECFSCGVRWQRHSTQPR